MSVKKNVPTKKDISFKTLVKQLNVNNSKERNLRILKKLKGLVYREEKYALFYKDIAADPSFKRLSASKQGEVNKILCFCVQTFESYREAHEFCYKMDLQVQEYFAGINFPGLAFFLNKKCSDGYCFLRK